MKKVVLILSFISVVLLLTACGEKPTSDTYFYDYSYSRSATDDQFDFDGNYLPPELTVDGIKDETVWQTSASNTLTFGNNSNASVSFYRGERALYAFFEVKDETLLTLSDKGGDDTNKGDSIELYINVLNDEANKPQTDDIQINIGINGKTRLLVGDNGAWGLWSGLIDYAIRLEGTLNQTDDSDKGYSIELMIPYAQINMRKEDVIGVALGHVDKKTTGNSAGIDYQWEGLVFEGEFTDPQKPSGYVNYQEAIFYKRGNEPLSKVNFDIEVVDQNHATIRDAKIMIENQTQTLTDQLGKGLLENIDRNQSFMIEVSKAGYVTYQKTYTGAALLNLNQNNQLKVVLTDTTIEAKTTLQGVINNLDEGALDQVKVDIKSGEHTYTVYTDQTGLFNQEITIGESISLTISKSGLKTQTYFVRSEQLIVSGITQLDNLEMMHQSEVFSFGGQRGITGFNGTVSKGLLGYHFTFESTNEFPNTAKIELFIDTKQSTSTRDSSDYRIDFSANGTIGIVNFGDGTNTNVATSGITMKVDRQATISKITAFIPYTFLQIETHDFIGISAGVFSGSDWDGWSFNNEFIAPEIPTNYVRIAQDSTLYRYQNNQETQLFTGLITDDKGHAIADAWVNNVKTNQEGVYQLRALKGQVQILNISKPGYISAEIMIPEENKATLLLNKVLQDNYLVTIEGHVGLSDVKIYLLGNEASFVLSDEEGNYQLEAVDGRKDVLIIFEKEGYYSLEKTIESKDLLAGATTVVDAVLVNKDVQVTLSGTVNSAYGPIALVTVKAQGKTALTDENGYFIFDDLDVIQTVISFEKEGYETKETLISQLDIKQEEPITIEILKIASSSGTFSGKNNEFTKASFKAQRGITGIYFTFIGETPFRTTNNQNEVIELFIDTKVSDQVRNQSDYRINIAAAGHIKGIENWGGNNTNITTLLVTKINEYTIELFIPYVFLDIAADEEIGISIGVWNEFVNDWDGWGFDGAFVAPEVPSQYIRLDKDNQLFRK